MNDHICSDLSLCPSHILHSLPFSSFPVHQCPLSNLSFTLYCLLLPSSFPYLSLNISTVSNPPPSLCPSQTVDDHSSHFTSIELVKSRPTHLLVFLQHVILQFDCSSLVRTTVCVCMVMYCLVCVWVFMSMLVCDECLSAPCVAMFLCISSDIKHACLSLLFCMQTP